MPKHWLQVSALFAVFVAAPVGEAQKKGQAALTIGHLGAIGLMWHVAPRVALRSDLSFSKSRNENSSGAVDDVWSVALGLSGLFYFLRADSLHGYVVPRVSYSKVDGESGVISETSSLGAAFGLQYILSRKFSVFGEAGLQYSWVTLPVVFQGERLPEGHRQVWDTRSGIGLVFYFR